MKTTERIMWLLAGFFVASTIVYTVWTILWDQERIAQDPNGDEGNPIEWAGTIPLFLAAILSVLIAYYVRRSLRALGETPPSDRTDANIDDDDPEQGFFSPWSWWPMTLSISAGLVFVGLAVGVWLCFIGAVAAVISIVGLVFEYYRGVFAR
ncbi:cytochrome c oxidase subunit 4 [Leifsonia sp. SIMBA_070]|uniref:cytochrome c oxidase subunit 4 n=1 Tax=Leifsonia sp. SIMBA_070 TaxID=3085810 RepID=UPI00397939BA